MKVVGNCLFHSYPVPGPRIGATIVLRVSDCGRVAAAVNKAVQAVARTCPLAPPPPTRTKVLGSPRPAKRKLGELPAAGPCGQVFLQFRLLVAASPTRSRVETADTRVKAADPRIEPADTGIEAASRHAGRV